MPAEEHGGGKVLYLRIKRGLDLMLSAVLGIALLPLFGVIAVCVRLGSPGPVLFRQERIGRSGGHFLMVKFRTMAEDAPHDMPTAELSDADRWITPVGRVLRRTSLDELPQIWNILLGDMSFVGPRPALWNQDELIAERKRYVGRYGLTPNDLRPGLTGWAQVNGRDMLEDAEKAALDGEYARRVSFVFALLCLWRTVRSVPAGEGVQEGGPHGPKGTGKG